MGKLSPRIPGEHNKYHGYTVRGTPNGPLIFTYICPKKSAIHVGEYKYIKYIYIYIISYMDPIGLEQPSQQPSISHLDSGCIQ